MSTSSLFFISFTLLVLILTVQSVYNVFSYDDGSGEHCCIVRVRENFCLATPITRSLVQVNKQCHRFDKPKHRRSGGKKRNNKYLEKISRRLTVQVSHEIDDKIFLQLKTPLEKHLLEKDLICLTSTNNNINLDKCYIEFDNKVKDKKKQQDEEDSITDNEIHQLELNQPVLIHEGHGLSVRGIYKLNPNNIRSTDRQQRQCLSWYRTQIQRIRHNPSKNRKPCIKLMDHNEKCINQLAHNTFNMNETNDHEQYTSISFPIGSKLYCENSAGSKKLLGFHHYGQICFQTQDEVYIEHKFTDIASLSDRNKNKDTLTFIENNKKLSAEFGDDCHDQTTLVEIIQS